MTDVKKRNDDHKILCTNTDKLLAKMTREKDLESFEKMKAARPLKPPRRRSQSNG